MNVLGNQITVLGLRRIGEAVEAARRRLPPGSRERRELDEVVRFNRLARENFGLTTPGAGGDQRADQGGKAGGRR